VACSGGPAVSAETDFADFGFVPVAAAAPPLTLADPQANLAAIREARAWARQEGAALLLLPELAITGYTCEDLFYGDDLLHESTAALAALARETEDGGPVIVAGAPLAGTGRPPVQRRLRAGRWACRGRRTEDPPAQPWRVLRAALVRRGCRRRSHGRGRRARIPAQCAAAVPRRPLALRRGGVRGPLGAAAAGHGTRPRRRRSRGQSLGEQRIDRQGRLPAGSGAHGERAAYLRLPLRRGRARREFEGPRLRWSSARCRERGFPG
jgi:hypothetical protein